MNFSHTAVSCPKESFPRKAFATLTAAQVGALLPDDTSDISIQSEYEGDTGLCCHCGMHRWMGHDIKHGAVCKETECECWMCTLCSQRCGGSCGWMGCGHCIRHECLFCDKKDGIHEGDPLLTHPEIPGGYMHESCKHTWRKSYAYMTIIDLHLLIQSSHSAKQCFKDTRQLLETPATFRENCLR